MDFNKLLAARQAAAKARGIPQVPTLPPKSKVSAPPPGPAPRPTPTPINPALKARGIDRPTPTPINPALKAQDIVTAPPVAPGMKKGGKVKKMASGGKVRGAGIAKRGIGKCKAC